MDQRGHDVWVVLYVGESVAGSSIGRRSGAPRGMNLFLPGGTSGDCDSDMAGVVVGVVGVVQCCVVLPWGKGDGMRGFTLPFYVRGAGTGGQAANKCVSTCKPCKGTAQDILLGGAGNILCWRSIHPAASYVAERCRASIPRLVRSCSAAPRPFVVAWWALDAFV
jgi:hypothetical protein